MQMTSVPVEGFGQDFYNLLLGERESAYQINDQDRIIDKITEANLSYEIVKDGHLRIAIHAYDYNNLIQVLKNFKTRVEEFALSMAWRTSSMPATQASDNHDHYYATYLYIDIQR